MIRFFRLLVRVRYWKRRALSAEKRHLDLTEQFAAEKAALQSQMEAERWRNVAREDTYASATILGGRGMWGVAPRTGPASTQRPTSLLEVASQSGVPVMSGPDRMEFETQWLPYAEQNGISRQQAERDFLRELANRKALHDEPMM